MKLSIPVFIIFLLTTLCFELRAQTAKSRKKKAKHNTTISKPVITPADLEDPTAVKDSLLQYSVSLLGTPYRYASTDPTVGFDCSGFITHVFNHFNLTVPRSSVDFTDYGHEIQRGSALPGDLILFTGTDSTVRKVGHMGIVVENREDGIKFIHSSSGHANGVTITPLNSYYMGRFMKTIRVFRE